MPYPVAAMPCGASLSQRTEQQHIAGHASPRLLHQPQALVSPCHAMPCHAMRCHATPCDAMPRHAMPCHAMRCHATPCDAMPRHAMPCHAMPCHAMPCHAMPCHAMPCIQYNVSSQPTHGPHLTVHTPPLPSTRPPSSLHSDTSLLYSSPLLSSTLHSCPLFFPRLFPLPPSSLFPDPLLPHSFPLIHLILPLFSLPFTSPPSSSPSCLLLQISPLFSLPFNPPHRLSSLLSSALPLSPPHSSPPLSPHVLLFSLLSLVTVLLALLFP
ncbi:unnamed protein product [Closterium sp. NIES-54]